jgi:hypothetical protein
MSLKPCWMCGSATTILFIFIFDIYTIQVYTQFFLNLISKLSSLDKSTVYFFLFLLKIKVWNI